MRAIRQVFCANVGGLDEATRDMAATAGPADPARSKGASQRVVHAVERALEDPNPLFARLAALGTRLEEREGKLSLVGGRPQQPRLEAAFRLGARAASVLMLGHMARELYDASAKPQIGWRVACGVSALVPHPMEILVAFEALDPTPAIRSHHRLVSALCGLFALTSVLAIASGVLGGSSPADLNKSAGPLLGVSLGLLCGLASRAQQARALRREVAEALPRVERQLAAASPTCSPPQGTTDRLHRVLAGPPALAKAVAGTTRKS